MPNATLFMTLDFSGAYHGGNNNVKDNAVQGTCIDDAGVVWAQQVSSSNGVEYNYFAKFVNGRLVADSGPSLIGHQALDVIYTDTNQRFVSGSGARFVEDHLDLSNPVRDPVHDVDQSAVGLDDSKHFVLFGLETDVDQLKPYDVSYIKFTNDDEPSGTDGDNENVTVTFVDGNTKLLIERDFYYTSDNTKYCQLYEMDVVSELFTGAAYIDATEHCRLVRTIELGTRSSSDTIAVQGVVKHNGYYIISTGGIEKTNRFYWISVDTDHKTVFLGTKTPYISSGANGGGQESEGIVVHNGKLYATFAYYPQSNTRNKIYELGGLYKY